MDRFIRVNGKDFSLDEVAKALGVKGLGEPVQVALCQKVADGVLTAKGAAFEGDEYPGIDVELELPAEKDSMPVMISRTEQPRAAGEVGKVRTFGYSRDDEYFMFFDVDTRSDAEVDLADTQRAFQPSLVVSGDPYYDVAVYQENQYVQYQGYIPDNLQTVEYVDFVSEVKLEDLKVGMVGNLRERPEFIEGLCGKAFEIVGFSDSGRPMIAIEGIKDLPWPAEASWLENVRTPEVDKGRDVEVLLKEAGIDDCVGFLEPRKALHIQHGVEVFLNNNDEMCCRFPGETDVSPLVFDIRDIKEGDAFLLGDKGDVRTTSDDAHFDFYDAQWFVHGDDGEVYFAEDIGREFGEKLRSVLEKMESPLVQKMDSAVRRSDVGYTVGKETDFLQK